MGEKKEIKISLTTFFLIIAIIIIVAMGAFIYMQKIESDRKIAELQKNINELQEKNDSTANIENTTNIKDIYDELQKQCEGVVYRRETGGSSAFFIKNGILYSGEENISETQTKTFGITENVKYVVPKNKQTNETIALTEDGKLYINKEEEKDLYGKTFERLLANYTILEILQLPNEEEFKFLSSEGKIINMDGTIYLDLLNADNKNETLTENEIYKKY